LGCGEQQSGGGVSEDGVIKRRLYAERQRHRRGEKRQQTGARPCDRAASHSKKQTHAESKLGRSGKDREPLSKGGRQEAVDLLAV
jgi:hypothetical protein